jgi:hypothetical protein
MRTTLDIDEAVLMAAKELARREHKTTGDRLPTAQADNDRTGRRPR